MQRSGKCRVSDIHHSIPRLFGSHIDLFALTCGAGQYSRAPLQVPRSTAASESALPPPPPIRGIAAAFGPGAFKAGFQT